MRHGKKFNHLGRKSSHRKAMLSNMACSLIEHKRIKTTVAKAKALRKFIEPLITKSKTDTTHSRRIVFSHLKQKDAITELFGDIASKVNTRNGGYTRILRTGNRLGDNAEMCFIELVDYNETYVTDKPNKKTKSTRRSGGTKKVSTNRPVVEEAVVVEETKTEDVVEEKSEATEETKIEELVEEATEAPASEVVLEEKSEATEETKTEELVEEATEAPASEVDEEEIKEEKNAEDNETKVSNLTYLS